MKRIALCFSTPGMDKDLWHYPDYGKKYPGAGWMKYLKHVAVSGASVKHDPKNVHIIQEESNQDGIFLQELGAQRSVITCLESPIYAPLFYDKRAELQRQGWSNALLFSHGTEHLHFPSYDSEDIRDPEPWLGRKFLCMVTSNKHYSGLPWINKSESFKTALETQLQDYRYGAIKHFSPSSDFNLYGRGWLHGAFECQDKIETISKYKFALCFENGSYPGYITEKIIDCFVAGVVPVYMGAPDIEKYIPRGLFIDARQFKSFQEMDEYLREHQDVNLMHMIRDAQDWLRVGNGAKYNNLNFAKRILEMCVGT